MQTHAYGLRDVLTNVFTVIQTGHEAARERTVTHIFPFTICYTHSLSRVKFQTQDSLSLLLHSVSLSSLCSVKTRW